MNKQKLKLLIISSVFFFGLIFCISPAQARTQVTDWYVKNFDSQIAVNKDSSLDITETITADCGNASGKHGIFRILPEEINITGIGKVKTPVKLESITDANGNKYKYTAEKSIGAKTITWKIGDADKTVTGVNVYVIKYKVKNAIRFFDKDFDEFYWNLTGNFWDLEIDKSHIEVVFPSEIRNDEVATNLYSGALGQKGNVLSEFFWNNDGRLIVNSTRTISKGEGITASVTFPKGIFVPYVPTFLDLYGRYFFLIIPILVFIGCFLAWRKYGKDPYEKKTVIAEYEVPGKLSPIALGMLEKNCKLDNKFITAEIIQLATMGIITIKEIEKKIVIFKSKDYELTHVEKKEAEKDLSEPQKEILEAIFSGKNVIKLSSLKNKFHKSLKSIKKETILLLKEKDLIVVFGLKLQKIFIVVAIASVFISFLLMEASGYLGLSLFVSGVIIFIFSFIMPKRTEKGTELNWRIKGFKLFMKTVDRDRAPFYEKENMFEKCLPYAILFGMTKEWVKRIKEIYGEEYLTSHAPVWYTGYALVSFDADSFSSAIDRLSSSVASNTSSPSGSGGSGGAGGGGGGGGGGGW